MGAWLEIARMTPWLRAKPLQAHTLMQAIARSNRVKEGKNNGLIVDYCGILKKLRKALATFAGHTGGGALGEPASNLSNRSGVLSGCFSSAFDIMHPLATDRRRDAL